MYISGNKIYFQTVWLKCLNPLAKNVSDNDDAFVLLCTLRLVTTHIYTNIFIIEILLELIKALYM